MEKRQDLKVFITTHESTCDECGNNLGKKAWITLAGEQGALCLACAELDHLVFLPSGDAALTRRARKHSTLSALVLKWSRARKRYERQGILVEEAALAIAEKEYLVDEEARIRRREREAKRREQLDLDYVEGFAGRVCELFPNIPLGTDKVIAEHACLKYSDRVGRSAAAKAFEATAVRLAVIAHIRHTETPYDELLGAGYDRNEARRQIEHLVSSVLNSWQQS